MRPIAYLLQGKFVVPCKDVVVWAEGMSRLREENNLRVGDDAIGNTRVITIFTGVDWNFSLRGAPQPFETMVFGGRDDGWTRHYATWEQAGRGHQSILRRVKSKGERKKLHENSNQVSKVRLKHRNLRGRGDRKSRP